MAKKKKQFEVCPEPKAFSKWYRGRVSRNIDELIDKGKSVRVFGFSVSEEQINNKFRLLKSPKPGEVLAKLQECGFPAVNKAKPGEDILIAIDSRKKGGL